MVSLCWVGCWGWVDCDEEGLERCDCRGEEGKGEEEGEKERSWRRVWR